MKRALLVIAGAAFLVWAWLLVRQYQEPESKAARQARTAAFVIVFASGLAYAAISQPKRK